MKTKLHLAALAALLLLPRSGSARTVSWYSAIGDSFLTANASAWDSTLSFSLGAFSSGFTPTATNMSLWQSNWMTFDTATTANGGWSSTPPFPNFSSFDETISAGSNLVRADDDPAGAGTTNLFGINGSPLDQPVYIWAYNSQAFSPTNEWALITNGNWGFPSSDLGNPNSVDFALSDPGTTAVFGNFQQQAAGPDTVSTLQTQVVPEPGTALLIAVAGILLRLKRRYR